MSAVRIGGSVLPSYGLRWLPGINRPRRVCFLLLGTIVLALASSSVALVFAMRSEQAYKEAITANLQQADAIHALQRALLSETAANAWQLLDGSESWRQRLISAQDDFEKCLVRLASIGLESDQQALIEPIRDAHQLYIGERSRQQLSSGREGRTGPMNVSAETAYQATARLCNRLAGANDVDIARAIAARHTEARRVATRMGVVLGMLAVAGVVGCWLLFWRVLGPLRRISNDVREYLDIGHVDTAVNEIHAVDRCVQNLKSTVAQAHANLAVSEQRLVDAQQLVTVGKLAAGVAHEIRSPLTSLKLRLFSVQKALGDDAPGAADLRIMSEELDRLDSIIKNFLEFSRPPELRVQPCDVTFLVDKTLDLLRYKLEAARVGLIREGIPDIPPLLVDPHQMRQVLLNLLNNAIDAQPNGGTIRISVAREGGAADSTVMLRIRDTGTGIPADLAGRIFDPFFSTRREGAGLGLWIAHRIVTQHGGMLQLEETGPGGSVFTMSIPILRDLPDEQNSGGGRRSERALRV